MWSVWVDKASWHTRVSIQELEGRESCKHWQAKALMIPGRFWQIKETPLLLFLIIWGSLGGRKGILWVYAVLRQGSQTLGSNIESLNFYPLSPPWLSSWEKSYIIQCYTQPNFPTLPRFLLASKTTWHTHLASPTCTSSLLQNIKTIIATQTDREHALKFHLTSERIIRLARLVERGYWNRFSTAREQKRMWK